MNLRRLTRLRIPVVIRNIFGSWQVWDAATNDYWRRKGRKSYWTRYYNSQSIANRAVFQHMRATGRIRCISCGCWTAGLEGPVVCRRCDREAIAARKEGMQ